MVVESEIAIHRGGWQVRTGSDREKVTRLNYSAVLRSPQSSRREKNGSIRKRKEASVYLSSVISCPSINCGIYLMFKNMRR